MIKKEGQLKLNKTQESIKEKIFIIRGQKVMLDFDLAGIYEVPVKRLNEQVKRNKDRFPQDFMFQLSDKETEILNQSQFATGSQKHRDPRFLPYAFTEHGIAMLSSVLNSPRAVQMNIYIIRAFIRMREMFLIDKNVELKLLQFKVEIDKRGEDIDRILEILKNLLNEPIKPLGPMGFDVK